jgi:hypothetical protein
MTASTPRNTPTEPGKLDLGKFPPLENKRRFFYVKHRAHRTEPVTVELRESQSRGYAVLGMSTLLGFDHTIADAESIYETAKKIDARVSQIDEVIGLYVQP